MDKYLIPSINNSNKPDINWFVQGRIIPQSVTGSDTILYLQTRHRTWLEQHFHTGSCPIPAELAVEIAMTILVPFTSKLVAKSYDFAENTRGLFYTPMVKMLEPEESIVFVTVTGMTAIVKLDGLDTIFRHDSTCNACRDAENYDISGELMDKMLEGAAPHELEH